MRNFLLGLLLVSTLTFSQGQKKEKTSSFNVTELVSVEIKGNNIKVDIKEYKGTIKVNYWNVNQKSEVYTYGEYLNMLGFTEQGTLPTGTYTIEVIVDGTTTTKTFKLPS